MSKGLLLNRSGLFFFLTILFFQGCAPSDEEYDVNNDIDNFENLCQNYFTVYSGKDKDFENLFETKDMKRLLDSKYPKRIIFFHEPAPDSTIFYYNTIDSVSDKQFEPGLEVNKKVESIYGKGWKIKSGYSVFFQVNKISNSSNRFKNIFIGQLIRERSISSQVPGSSGEVLIEFRKIW